MTPIPIQVPSQSPPIDIYNEPTLDTHNNPVEPAFIQPKTHTIPTQIPSPTASHMPLVHELVPLRKSTRVSKLPGWSDDFVTPISHTNTSQPMLLSILPIWLEKSLKLKSLKVTMKQLLNQDGLKQ